jgi:hypothetical protein
VARSLLRPLAVQVQPNNALPPLNDQEVEALWSTPGGCNAFRSPSGRKLTAVSITTRSYLLSEKHSVKTSSVKRRQRPRVGKVPPGRRKVRSGPKSKGG